MGTKTPRPPQPSSGTPTTGEDRPVVRVGVYSPAPLKKPAPPPPPPPKKGK